MFNRLGKITDFGHLLLLGDLDLDNSWSWNLFGTFLDLEGHSVASDDVDAV